MKKILAMMMALCCIAVLLAGCDSGSGTVSGYAPISTFPSVETRGDIAISPNSQYEEIFTSRYIVEPAPFFFGLDAVAFAKVDSDGMIEKMEYGCNGDSIQEIIHTFYFPVSGKTDDEKAYLENYQRNYLASLDAASCTTITHDMGYSYYTIKIKISNAHLSDNIRQLYAAGYLDSAPDYLSISQTESSLLSNGYIKR